MFAQKCERSRVVTLNSSERHAGILLKVRKNLILSEKRLSGSRFLRLFLLFFKEKSGRRRGFFRFVKKERENGGEYSRERTNDDGNIDDDENAFESPEGGFDDVDDVCRRLFCCCIVQW